MRGFLPHTDDEIRAMLETVGVGDIEDLFSTVPDSCRFEGDLDLAPGESEHGVARRMDELAGANRPAGARLNFMGGGVYDRVIPSVMAHVLSRPEFYTAYTPYQPEVSQGTLQVIFEFQTLMARLTGMEVANASLYDGASALAEALLLAGSATRRELCLLPASLQPEARNVAATYGEGLGYRFTSIDWDETGRMNLDALRHGLEYGEKVAAVAVQQPNHFGVVEDIAAIAPIVHEAGALLIVHVEPGSLALLESPGAQGADIVTGEGQSLGLPMSFGGPYLGIIGVSKKLVRKLPGRLVGRTTDDRGGEGYVLTLQTREQHIRREKATSNICTNQGLMALAATVYLSALGESGLRALARGLADRAGTLATAIEALPGYRLPLTGPIYQEFVVEAPVPAAEILTAGAERGIAPGLALGAEFPTLGERALLVTVSEKHDTADLDRFLDFLKEFSG